MDANRWLHDLRANLVRRKLPPQYIERFVLELSDHLTDCMEDPMSTDAKDLHGVFTRLGEPANLAAKAAAEYRGARFSRRHPVLVFLLLPVLSLPVLWFGYVLCLMLAAKLLGLESGKVDTDTTLWQWANACTPLVVLGMLLVPAGLAAAFFCRLAAKAGVHWAWPVVACCVLGVLAGLTISDFVLPTEYTRGQLQVGFRLAKYPTASQVAQFLLPLSIGGWAVWHQMRRRVGPTAHA